MAALSNRKTIRKNAIAFVKTWGQESREEAEAKSFWDAFFKIFGITRKEVAAFEYSVERSDKTHGYIDLFWKGVLLVEHKSRGKSLEKAGSQAFDYFQNIAHKRDQPRFVLLSDFARFRLYDLELRTEVDFSIEALPDQIEQFDFMAGLENHGDKSQEYELNIKAAERLGTLHDALSESGYSGHDLEVFLVRILFCLFAEDTGIFDRHQFYNYVLNFTREDGSDLEMHLLRLFQVLDKPEGERNKNITEELDAFPYVNGHLFAERLDFPSFDEEMRDALIDCAHFDWSTISPAIFGSLFQSVMDKAARRELGAHYTSESNILRLIKPLFLDALWDEFAEIQKMKQANRKQKSLIAFQQKLTDLQFFDPACGCGNFLIITYRELRRLELALLYEQHGDSITQSLSLDIQPAINLEHFHGIEIEEFPARIAEVAMWLTQHQMNREFAKQFGVEPDLLPLRSAVHIVNDNALRIDWAKVVLPSQLNYIVGNPPFVGHQYRTEQQKADMAHVFPKKGKFGKLDFVASWFYKAAVFSKESSVEMAFVSTNSICQGESAGALWMPLLDMGVCINFAHRTFQWSNDAKGKAAVHCVIVGFAYVEWLNKLIVSYPDIQGDGVELPAKYINPYLIDAETGAIPSRSKPLQDRPKMTKGSQPTDGGFLVLSDIERDELLAKSAVLGDYIKPFLGSRELINDIERYCLWFADASVKDKKKFLQIPEIKTRLAGVKESRLASPTKSVQEYADLPYLFTQNRQPENNFLAVPEVSSQRRRYVPISYLDDSYVPSNKIYTVPDTTLFDFGVLISEMHMDWMRVVAGRLKNDYSYSPNVYHLFPFPDASDKQKKKVELCAQTVLDERTKEEGASLADLYDPDTMPQGLLKAHKALDKAVEQCYRRAKFKDDMDRLSFLFQRYQELKNTNVQ